MREGEKEEGEKVKEQISDPYLHLSSLLLLSSGTYTEESRQEPSYFSPG